MWQLMGGFVRENIQIHFGQEVFGTFGEEYVPMLERVVVLGVFWLILFWMYQQRFFVRL